MSAEIITLPVVRIEREPPNPGNGAREALIEIGKNCPFHVQDDLAGCWSDDVLMRLWERGFKVVPLGADE